MANTKEYQGKIKAKPNQKGKTAINTDNKISASSAATTKNSSNKGKGPSGENL